MRGDHITAAAFAAAAESSTEESAAAAAATAFAVNYLLVEQSLNHVVGHLKTQDKIKVL